MNEDSVMIGLYKFLFWERVVRMINIYEEQIGDIPVLQVVQSKQMNEALPTVVYYHGFRGEKDSSLTLAYKLAKEGFRVVLPDSNLHGKRQESITESELELSFWDIVIKNIEELDEIKLYLEKEQLLLSGRIGVGGTSMGGITTFAALKKYDWIKVGTALMGTPKISEFAEILIEEYNKFHEEKITDNVRSEVVDKLMEFDLSKAPGHLQNRPLLIWHGEEDKIVPPEHSVSFYDEVKHQYGREEFLQLIIEKGRGHHISRLSIEEAVNWFKKYL